MSEFKIHNTGSNKLITSVTNVDDGSGLYWLRV
jgi:hypothetical protein